MSDSSWVEGVRVWWEATEGVRFPAVVIGSLIQGKQPVLMTSSYFKWHVAHHDSWSAQRTEVEPQRLFPRNVERELSVDKAFREANE